MRFSKPRPMTISSDAIRAGSTVLAFSDSVRTITRIEAAFGAAAADTDLTGRISVVSPRNLGAHLVKRT